MFNHSISTIKVSGGYFEGGGGKGKGGVTQIKIMTGGNRQVINNPQK